MNIYIYILYHIDSYCILCDSQVAVANSTASCHGEMLHSEAWAGWPLAVSGSITYSPAHCCWPLGDTTKSLSKSK